MCNLQRHFFAFLACALLVGGNGNAAYFSKEGSKLFLCDSGGRRLREAPVVFKIALQRQITNLYYQGTTTMTFAHFRRVCVLLAILCCCRAAGAAIRNVPAQYSTIQAAINAAVAGDTVMVGPGIYTGPGNVSIDPLGKAITIKSSGGYGSCILDGLGSSQLFYIHSGETPSTVISGFTIEGGYGDYGGAAFVDNSSPTFKYCLFQNNTANYNGGAVFASGSNIVCTSDVFDTNGTINYYGGAVEVDAGTPNFSSCTFTGNSAVADGGGMFLDTTTKAKVTSCLFTSNTSPSSGGGLLVEHDTASVTAVRSAVIPGSTAAASRSAGGTQKCLAVRLAGTRHRM